MSNLPITASTPQAAAAKPAQAAATTEDSATPSQPFGDVLARQVSDAATTDSAIPAKKTIAKSAEELLTDDDTTPVAAANQSTDMLAALIPQGMPIADKAAPAVEVNDLPNQAAQTEEATGLPNQVALTAMASEATGLPKQTAAETTATAKPSALPSPLAKTDLGVSQSKSAPAAGVISAQTDAKKDAAFASMLASMNPATTNKSSDADEKALALAAAPQPNSAALASMQATASPLNPANVFPTQLTINTPVTHDNWGDEFNQKITWLATNKEQTAELHLNPPQLGPMDVVIKVSGDQATALFTSPHAAVRDAIELALPRLREMMADSGIMLGNASVSDQASRNRQNDAEGRSPNSRAGVNGIADTAALSNLSMRVSPISRHNGIVDTFA